MKTTSIDVPIERGTPHNYEYVLHGEANEAPGVPAGNLHIKFIIKDHKRFSRKGADLYMEQKITLLEALTGFAK